MRIDLVSSQEPKAQGPGEGVEWRFGFLSSMPSLENLSCQPQGFRATDSWKSFSLPMTPGAQMQMMSAPNIDRRDSLPLPSRGASGETT